MDSKRLQRIPVKYRKEVETEVKRIAEIVRNRREKLGLTQEQLAERLDVNTITIQFIEQSRRLPSFPMLFYILKALNVSISFRS